MEYRTDSRHDVFTQQNERRADQIEHALTIATDKNGEVEGEVANGTYTDVSDLLASVRHFCDRAGIDFDDVDDHAERAYEGDLMEDGPKVVRDTDRFPEGG